MSAKDPPAPTPSKLTNFTITPSPTPGQLATEQQHAWMDTYNAVLGGLYANQTAVTQGRDYLHQQALLAAELRHGPFPPDPPSEP